MSKENLNEILNQLNNLGNQVKDLIEEKQTNIEEECSERIVDDGDVIHLFAELGYNSNVNLLCKLEDTGNGFIAYFPSYTSVEQDNYICMDYAEAEYIRKLLNYLNKR